MASLSTPAQFHYFVPALPIVHDMLVSLDFRWDYVVEAVQAVCHLVLPNQPQQIDVLMEHNIYDQILSIFQDCTRNSALRWHASIFIWSVAQHCSNPQMRKLLRLMGILGSVCQVDNAHPHLRAAALNIMQVMLQRGEFIVQQFVYRRDNFPARVMDLLRDHKHEKLIHGPSKTSNCIIKYASFTLTSATVGANKDQLTKLLDLGLYPLLFKIVSLEGEPDKPEEAKLKAIAALSHVLQEMPDQVKTIQQREERKSGEAASAAWWAEVQELTAAVGDEESGGSEWSEELREKAQELLDMAVETDLVSRVK